MADQEPMKNNTLTISSSITDSPGKQPTSKKKNSLSLTPNSLDRHPSAIHLGEHKEEEPPSFSGVNVILANPEHKEESYQLSLSTTDEKLYNGSETYYIHSLNKQISLTSFPKTTNSKIIHAQKHKSFSAFSIQQKILDDQITQCIQNGDDFDKVKETLSTLHKLKKDT